MSTSRSERGPAAEDQTPTATVLVAGGRGGIGGASAAALTGAGWQPLILDKSDGVDAADERAVRAFLDEQGRPPLRAVVVSCGRVGSGGVADTDAAAWRSVMRDNLDAAYVLIREAMPLLRAAGGDRCIVLMSSVNGRTGGNTLSGPAYAVAKAGLIGLCLHPAQSLAAEGIRVNAIAPGPVDTAMTQRLTLAQLGALLERVPLRRVATADEIAGAVMFLLSPAARSITGSVVDVNGGMWMG